MTRHEENTAIGQMLEAVIEDGMEALETAITILLNEAMKVEGNRVLGAEPWRRTEHRRGCANGLGHCPYVVLDARYENVRVDGTVRSCAVLIAAGVRDDGRRSLLGVSCSLSEAEVHWRGFLTGLKQRGLHGVEMITSDDHEGLKAALRATFHAVAWNHCHFHLQRNASTYVPKVHMRAQVAEDIRSILSAPSRDEAERLLELTVERYAKSASRLSSWTQTALPEGFTVFMLPQRERRRLRTTNMLERVNKKVKRRTRVATLLPNEASLLRLVSAILMEISEDWETGRVYLKPTEDDRTA